MEHLHAHLSHHRHAAHQPRIVTVPCKYRAGRVLGHGTYAVVKEMVQIDTGEHFAGKVINKKHMQGREAAIPNEINILKRLSRRHANVVTLHDYFETPHNMYLVTELCTGGELFERICQEAAFTEQDAARIMRQIVSGVEFLHANGVVHRDLKTENCLFRTSDRDSTVAIADFGLSRIISSESNYALTTQCGTPGYMAPEVLQRCGHGRAVDMWAVGVITYFILSGTTPFERASPAAEIAAVVKCDYAFEPVEHWCRVSPAAQHFIASLLVYDPDRRMTAKQALKHPWLQGEQRMVMPPVSPSLPRVFRPVFGEEEKKVMGSDSAAFSSLPKQAEGRPSKPLSGQTLADTVTCSASTSARGSQAVGLPGPPALENSAIAVGEDPTSDSDSALESSEEHTIPQLHVEETSVGPGSPLADMGVPAFKTRTVHGGEEIEMGQQNLIPGFGRQVRPHTDSNRLALPGAVAPVDERTSQMDVDWLMTPGSSVCSDSDS